MTTQIYYLSPEENTAFRLLHEGFTTKHIAANCPLPISGWGIFTQEIKRKTGIQNLRDTFETRAFLEKYAAQMATRLTPEQARVLRWSLGQTHGPILGIPYDDAMILVYDACHSAAIFTKDDRARKAASRLYLALFRPNHAPLSPLETQILRALAEGKSYADMTEFIRAQKENFLKLKAKEACIRLNFDAPGRNAQRSLLRMYFAWLDAHCITMDDPLF